MNFGRHVITYEEQALVLNEAEIADLKNEGPKFWFVVAIADEPKKPTQLKKKATNKVSKKAA